jgi:HK97 family phage major capsid protein
MPWHISKMDKEYCVIKDEDGVTEKCHPTEQDAKDHMAALYASEMDEEKTVINYGQTVKALPDGKIGGYLVTFGGLDLTGEYFDQVTDFGEYARLPVMYHHGKTLQIKKRRIGTAEVTLDEIGLWAETQLEMRDEYERMVYELASNGKLGWSSGSAEHVIEREQDAKGVHITQWFMAEASLTPMPAEPRNTVIPLKSFMSDEIHTANQPTEGEPEAVQTAEREAGTESAVLQLNQGVKKMEITPEIQTLLDGVAEQAVKKFAESAPAVKTAEVNIEVTKAEGDQPWRSDGDYFKAVKTAAINPMATDQRLLALKATGLNEAIPSEGGFLLPPTVAPGILEKMHMTGGLLATINEIPVVGNSMTFNTVAETSRADGYRQGGLRGYWLEEGGAKTASAPKWSQISLKLHKVAALCYATDELLEDVGALAAWIGKAVPEELKFLVEDAIFEGDGVGKPLGLRSSPAMISVLRRTLLTIDAIDLAAMWARRYAGANDYVWLVSPSVYPAFLNMSVGNIPVWIPGTGITGANTFSGAIFGRPVIETEYSETLGTVGDIVLFSPSQYAAIGKSGGIQAASSIHVNFLYDESVYRFVYRVDGCPLWQSAITGYDGVTYSPYVQLATATA